MIANLGVVPYGALTCTSIGHVHVIGHYSKCGKVSVFGFKWKLAACITSRPGNHCLLIQLRGKELALLDD